MKLDRAQIEALIPHKLGMCLIDAVLDWDRAQIRCRSDSHRRPDHPLRRDGALSAVHLAEYGAQAMAIHGGLFEGERARPGMLVTLRDLELAVERIDDLPDSLIVTAQRLVGDANGWLYGFEVGAGGTQLARGRVGVLAIGG